MIIPLFFVAPFAALTGLDVYRLSMNRRYNTKEGGQGVRSMRSRRHGVAEMRNAAFVWLLPFFCACDAIPGLVGVLPPNRVTVQMVNNSDFAVEGELFYDDEDDTIEEILEETGTRRQFAIPAGGQNSFSGNCDDIRALIIADADLLIIGGVGPEASTGVLREGDDFDCGDLLIFTFDHSEAILDFDVSTSVRNAQ